VTALCPACGDQSLAPWRQAHALDRGQARSTGLPLSRCAECGSASLAGPPSSDRAVLHRSGAYASETGALGRAPTPLRAIATRDRLRLLGPLEDGSRVIEVGAGRGQLLGALRARGHDAVGIEPFAKPGPALADSVQRVEIERANFPDSNADLVVFWHVLEHLESPGDALALAARWLRPGGSVVVAAPNLASLQSRLGGDRWFHQDVPRHSTQFTVRGLHSLLRRAGFEPVATRHLMLEQNVLGMWLTLLNRFTVNRDVPYRFLKRDLAYARPYEAAWDAVASVLIGLPLLPVAGLAEFAGGLARRGGTVVVRARVS